jgi:hypothetical protein
MTSAPSDERLRDKIIKAIMDHVVDGEPESPEDLADLIIAHVQQSELERRSVTTQASEEAEPIGYVTAEDFKAMQSEDAPDVTVFQEGSTYGCVALYAAPQSKRVERLEAALRQIIDYAGPFPASTIEGIARQALGDRS